MQEVKQVIVIRREYTNSDGELFKPRTGKLIAQGAHASMKVLLDRMLKQKNEYSKVHEWWLRFAYEEPLSEWLNGSFAKIVVYVDSEQELLDVYAKAEIDDLPRSLIMDSGFTEFHGVPTYTAVAIGPWWSKEIDEITGELPLL